MITAKCFSEHLDCGKLCVENKKVEKNEKKNLLKKNIKSIVSFSTTKNTQMLKSGMLRKCEIMKTKRL